VLTGAEPTRWSPPLPLPAAWPAQQISMPCTGSLAVQSINLVGMGPAGAPLWLTGATECEAGVGWLLGIGDARPPGRSRAPATAPLLLMPFLAALRELFAGLFQPRGFFTQCGFRQAPRRKMHA